MKNILTYFVMKYKNSSFQNKLFYSYFILIFVPLLVLSFFSYNRSAQVITRQSKNIASLYLSQTESLVSSELLKMLTISRIVSQHSRIHDVLETADSDLSFSQEYDEMSILYQEVNLIKSLYNIKRIRLYISDNFRYSRSNEITYSISEIENEEWYKQMVNNKLTSMLLPPYTFREPMAVSTSQISMVTLIRSYGDFNKILGVVSVDMPESELMGYLHTVNYTKNSSAYIIDGKGNIVCSDGNKELLTAQSVQSMLPALLQAAKDKSVLTVDGIVIGVSNEVSGDWRIVSAASFRGILGQSDALKSQLFIFAAVIGILAYMLAYLYARSNSKRFKQLACQMKQVEKGNLSITCVVDSEDEIGELQNSFNFMVRRIDTLLREQYELGQNLQKMEIKVLQAQINPHFLYNTLDLISWKAKKSGNADIHDIVLKLARFYQISLSNGRELIPLKNEFEHIRLYVALQNLRLQKEIGLQMELDPKIEEFPVMKLLFQPIVENSIAHGILNMEEIQGLIFISANYKNGYIHIKITDNGTGIEKHKLTAILTHEYHASGTDQGGFGLLNVIDRLTARYGDRYTFDIVSEPLRGTTILIRIPAPSFSDA